VALVRASARSMVGPSGSSQSRGTSSSAHSAPGATSQRCQSSSTGCHLSGNPVDGASPPAVGVVARAPESERWRTAAPSSPLEHADANSASATSTVAPNGLTGPPGSLVVPEDDVGDARGLL